MERNTSCGDTFYDGDKVAVPAFDLLNDFLIAVDKGFNLVPNSELDALGKEGQNTSDNERIQNTPFRPYSRYSWAGCRIA